MDGYVRKVGNGYSIMLRTPCGEYVELREQFEQRIEAEKRVFMLQIPLLEGKPQYSM